MNCLDAAIFAILIYSQNTKHIRKIQGSIFGRGSLTLAVPYNLKCCTLLVCPAALFVCSFCITLYFSCHIIVIILGGSLLYFVPCSVLSVALFVCGPHIVTRTTAAAGAGWWKSKMRHNTLKLCRSTSPPLYCLAPYPIHGTGEKLI